MSFVLFLQPVYAVPTEGNPAENLQENSTDDNKWHCSHVYSVTPKGNSKQYAHYECGSR